VNPEVKALWLTDLRSGEFTQGKGMLRSTENEYCCLGVLCERAVREGIIPPPVLKTYYINSDNDITDRYEYGTGDDASTGTLPNAVREWAGLETTSPALPVPAELRDEYPTDPGVPPWHVSLAGINDRAGDRFPFPRIAELIEEYL
jgi:hypothetical protein